MNSCDSNVTVKTNSTDLTYRPIFILVGGRHQIVSVSPKNQWISIKASNATTNAALTIDGQDEIVVSYSINKYSNVYYVASGEFSQTFRIQSLFIVYVALFLALFGPVTKKFETLKNFFLYCAHSKALLLFIFVEIDRAVARALIGGRGVYIHIFRSCSTSFF